MNHTILKRIKTMGASSFFNLKTIFLISLVLFPIIMPQRAIFLGFISVQYVLFALGLNIVVGWTGLLDLGAAGFVAIGAYATAILMTQFGLSVLLVIPITFLVGAAFGILLGIPTLRHRSDYFAILTLGFAELVALGIRNWPSVTKGSYGYSGIPATILPFLEEPLRAVPPIGFYYLALSLALPIYFFIRWLRTTSLGRYFHIVKHNEILGRCYGINIIAVKIAAFGISAALLSLGGLFWATYQRSIVWTEFGVLLSCMLLSLLVVGGMGNPNGVVIGAIIIGTSSELLRSILTSVGLPQNIRFFIFASALILFIQFRPRGVIPDSPSWVPKKISFNLAIFKPKPPEASLNDSNNILLKIENLSKTFGGLVALDNFSFKTKKNECIALIGPNGAGKTTLINIISGILKPDSGNILFCDKKTNNLTAHCIARLGVGRSFQEICVFDDISVCNNVYLPSYNAQEINIKEALAKFEIGKYNSKCSSLSYGEKKSLDLARLFAEPTRLKLVLLDEPTAGLTQKEANNLVNKLLKIKRENALTMIVISHDIMFLDALNVDRVVVLNRGKLFKEGSFSDIRLDNDVRKLFWGD